MSDPKASTDGKYLINFGLFPREIRDAIYRECVIVEQPIDIIDDLHEYNDMTPLMYHYRQIRKTFGVLDGDNWPKKFTNEAREMFVAENTFIVPCSELPDFLDFQYTDNYGTSFDPKLFVRNLMVQMHHDPWNNASWLFKYQAPGLRRLLDCPSLQKLELSIRGPGGQGVKSETTRMIMNNMDVCMKLWKKLGRGMRTFCYDYDPTDKEANDEDEDQSETDGDIYLAPGKDSLGRLVLCRCRRVDASKTWQEWVERLKEPGQK